MDVSKSRCEGDETQQVIRRRLIDDRKKQIICRDDRNLGRGGKGGKGASVDFKLDSRIVYNSGER